MTTLPTTHRTGSGRYAIHLDGHSLVIPAGSLITTPDLRTWELTTYGTWRFVSTQVDKPLVFSIPGPSQNPNQDTWACKSCGWTCRSAEDITAPCDECDGRMARLIPQTPDQKEPDMPTVTIPATLAPRFVDFLACEARARHADERAAGTTWRDAMDVYATARHLYDTHPHGSEPMSMELDEYLRDILENPKGVNAAVAPAILALLWEPSDDARAAAQMMLGPSTHSGVVDARLREMHTAGYEIVKR